MTIAIFQNHILIQQCQIMIGDLLSISFDMCIKALLSLTPYYKHLSSLKKWAQDEQDFLWDLCFALFFYQWSRSLEILFLRWGISEDQEDSQKCLWHIYQVLNDWVISIPLRARLYTLFDLWQVPVYLSFNDVPHDWQCSLDCRLMCGTLPNSCPNRCVCFEFQTYFD